jgi:hypothetical protein
VRKDSPGVRAQKIILVTLASLLFRLVALWVVPDPAKPALDASLLDGVFAAADRYLHPAPQKEFAGPTLQEDSAIQKIRDELIPRILSERALRDEYKPPLPGGGLFPPGKLSEQEKMRLVERSPLYHELENVARNEDRLKDFTDIPGPKTSDVKGGAISIPEDVEAQRIIATLKQAAKEEAAQKPIAAAALGIKGPAAGRHVTYRPPPVAVKAAQEVERLIKFWVLPDGTVAKAIPLVVDEGPITLAAISQIKKYHFSPLPHNVLQEEMWGTIPVKSVLP